MKNTSKRVVLFLFAAGMACAACQSFEDGVAAVCNAETTCGKECANAAPEMVDGRLYSHIEDVVSNTDVKSFVSTLPVMSPAQRHRALNAMASRAGLGGCPLAQRYAPQNQPKE